MPSSSSSSRGNSPAKILRIPSVIRRATKATAFTFRSILQVARIPTTTGDRPRQLRPQAQPQQSRSTPQASASVTTTAGARTPAAPASAPQFAPAKINAMPFPASTSTMDANYDHDDDTVAARQPPANGTIPAAISTTPAAGLDTNTSASRSSLTRQEDSEPQDASMFRRRPKGDIASPVRPLAKHSLSDSSLVGLKDPDKENRPNGKVARPRDGYGESKPDVPANGMLPGLDAKDDMTKEMYGEIKSNLPVTSMLSIAVGALSVPMVSRELPTDPVELTARLEHQRFTEEALDMARLALKTNETPVGCVFVHNGRVIARGMNATNVTRNGTRHAEYMAISALLSIPQERPAGDAEPQPTVVNPNPRPDSSISNFPDSPYPDFALDPPHVRSGHLYPYGQRLLPPDVRVPRSMLRECDLYVTVEPCIMCASLLRQLGIRKVYFGAVNDKFGGTGGVFSIHANSPSVPAGPLPYMPMHPGEPGVADNRPGMPDFRDEADEGHGGNIEDGYPVQGGWGRDDAVALLRRFYVQENGRAPVPRKKEGRAARLAAMMAKENPLDIPPELAVHVYTGNPSDPGQKNDDESVADDD